VLFAWPEKADYRAEHAVECCSTENADFGNQQFLIGGEKLAGSRVTHDAERASREVGIRQPDRLRIGIRTARELAQDPVAVAGIGQNDRRTQLALGKIGKRERN